MLWHTDDADYTDLFIQKIPRRGKTMITPSKRIAAGGIVPPHQPVAITIPISNTIATCDEIEIEIDLMKS